MYKRGIEVNEKKTSYIQPLSSRYGVQVVIGTAPVNLIENPDDAVNKPIKVTSFSDAVNKLGYTTDWSYTLCQSIYASFKLFNVYPVIFINVLDPKKHTKEIEEKAYAVYNHQVIMEEQGILMDSVIVKHASAELKKDQDYILNFTDNGKLVVTLLSAGSGYELETLQLSCRRLAPEMVTERDIIGAYNMETGEETGLQLIRRVYPMFQLPPGLLLAPGWSHKSNVGAAIQEACTEINGVFKAECILDLDTTIAKKYTECSALKETCGYTDPHAIVLWPQLLAGGQRIAYSAVYGAMTSYYTATNHDIPYIYPSNKKLNVDGAVLEDGTRIMPDQMQTDYLNGDGIVTVTNDDGWRSWGNNTGCYPKNSDPKDRWIGCRRMFSFVSNYFILTYKERLDEAMNHRVIEDIVNSFNIWGNSLSSQGMCAGLRAEYDSSENPIEDLMDGKMKITLYVAPYTPLEFIQASEEFDITALQAAITGKEE